ncbi:hypothetical protein GJ688_18765 [Heliobacillus mobilis]|uniref:Spo0E like sporulation regulatory protein n=1 Tax=Heliobacterium mobile TaxID=28064 RepID=A0A6I3SRG1_HELMO|nr:hypothetical protein [Heliobacterium mobile]MTV50962.1 hypothetical protein [Heliobacterium mobile]
MKEEMEKILKQIYFKRHQARRLLVTRRNNEAIHLSREIDELLNEFYCLKQIESSSYKRYERSNPALIGNWN